MDARRAFWKERDEQRRKQGELAEAWKRITDDDDAMLLIWAKHCQPWADYSASEFVRYADWLRRADPVTLFEREMQMRWALEVAPTIGACERIRGRIPILSSAQRLQL
jgi:hypothetical protein